MCVPCNQSRLIIFVYWAAGPSRPSALVATKNYEFATRLEVLGWILDTHELTVTLTLRKQQKSKGLLEAWPMSRNVATARQVSELTGFLLHVSFALRPGKFVVGRLLAAVGMPPSAAFPAGVVDPGRRVVLGPEFHDDLEFW